MRTVCVYILLGLLSHGNQVSSQPKLTQRKIDSSESDIQSAINEIHSLSAENRKNTRSIDSSSMGLNAHDHVSTDFFAVFKPLLREGFIEELPRTFVCILSERKDCGAEAEITKTVSLELGKPLLFFLSSLRSHTCTPLSDGGHTQRNGPGNAYLGAEDRATSTKSGFPQTFLTILTKLPLFGTLVTTLSAVADAAVTYIVNMAATLIQVPTDYVQIALQFGIKIPSLIERESCEQGDLKQLIMWGMKHNVSWSFTNSIIDILLETLLTPELTGCTYADQSPECQNPPSFQRSVLESDTETNHNTLFRCDRQNLSVFNDTLCAEILYSSRVRMSTSVLNLCQALRTLNAQQVQAVWSNMCYVIQALVSPLLSKSSDCNVGDTQLFPAKSFAPHRKAREASNLQQLACDYNSWLESQVVDVVLVSLCSDNEQKEFVRHVCNNALLMRKLLSDQKNSWLYGYCANSSENYSYLVDQFCTYGHWIDQPTVSVNSHLLEFCISLDSQRLTRLICVHTGLFMLLFSNPENVRFMPNCTTAPLPLPSPGPDPLVSQSCVYSEWQDVMQITTDILAQCIRNDPSGFAETVCTNRTFLESLVRNQDNAWLWDHCSTALTILPTVTPEPLRISDWCNYHLWEDRQVDDSVVGFCWQHNQVDFQKNVCCKTSLLEKLLQNPQNRWLTSVCVDKEIEVLPKICKYSEWTRPIIVDMTDLALCAEKDPLNFTSKVCSNKTVLQNLMANPDNAWLIKYCANQSNLGVTPDEEGDDGGEETGFNPAEQCQYSTWTIDLPDAAILTLCWEHDQSNFVSSICSNPGLLFLLAHEPSSIWVSTMCATYTNYTTTGNKTTEGNFCLAKHLMRHFNWTCSVDLTSACQPDVSQDMVTRIMMRCWADGLRSRVRHLMTPSVATVFEQAVNTAVVVLLAIEEIQNTSLHVTKNVRVSVLESVVGYLERENNFDKKKVLLQCFGTVLTSLMPTARDASGNESLIIKEYFNVPLSSLKSVFSAAHITTVRMILQYYTRNKDTLKLPDKYLSTLTAVLFQNHLAKDGSLFSELTPLLEVASPADIHSLPSLQSNLDVRETINKNLVRMSADQRRAFGLWYSKVLLPSNITASHESLIRDTGNVITYLPFHNFQHLSPAQLLDGLDVLQQNDLSFLKQEFVAQTITGTYKNLTAQDFTRLGNLSCLAEPSDLLAYKSSEAFKVIWDVIMNCTRDGLGLPSLLTSSFLLNSTELTLPSSLSPDKLAGIAHLLPALGATFLQGLTPSQLLAALPALKTVSFSPAQAFIIVDKLSSINILSPLSRLQELGSLTVGVRTETLLMLTSDRLLLSLPDMAQHATGLRPPQANAISTKLWGFPDVVYWLDDVEPLLYCTPLLSILPRTHLLVDNISTASTKPWNTQQAKAIFKVALDRKPDLIEEDFLSLGMLGLGLSCPVLQQRFRADASPAAVRRILALLRQQPNPLHTSLKKCVIEEMYRFEFFSELLEDLGVEIALSMPSSTIKKFPSDLMDTLRRMIIADSVPFFMMSRTEQELLVDKMVQRMGMYTGVYTEEEFRSLGIMATFVSDEILIHLDRTFFTDNLDFLQTLCYSTNKMDIVARMLQEVDVFGPAVQDWNQTTLNQVDRFLFFLPQDRLQDISLALMTVGRIEKLFMRQRQWERGDVGLRCLGEGEKKQFAEKQQFVLQFFLGFLKMYPLAPAPMVPSCEILHTTAPSAWTSNSLASMSPSAFTNCLELIGQDPFLAPYQRSQVFSKVKQLYGPVSLFSQSVISQLGRLALEMSPQELSMLRLTERRSIASLGAVSEWTTRQLAALFAATLNSTKLHPSQLDSSTLVAVGHIVCGAKATDMSSFNAVEFSKAALWLGQLRLSCSEEQLLALVGLLTHRLAFGPISSWEMEVFIEIGVLAAGLPDMAMSALVKEQIEGITPSAITTIKPDKFAVVFHQRQISMFSYGQAAAVTDEQLSALSDVQRTALAMVLMPWEDRHVDFRGRSHAGKVMCSSFLCLILALLMMLMVQARH
ncbi:stereocilin [Nerophis ophidion]|uniref:stereocilin n=1 Tax=Nerophis ophidion TaxID=159077 RepID=UPI002AE079B2|nr:stereocilin [Nerophis ophidion]